MIAYGRIERKETSLRTTLAFAIVYTGGSDLPRPLRGAVAHLGERFNGIEEAEGSSPSSSTNRNFPTPEPRVILRGNSRPLRLIVSTRHRILEDERIIHSIRVSGGDGGGLNSA